MKEMKRDNFFIKELGATRVYNVCDAQTLQLLSIKCCCDRTNVEMVVNLNGHGFLVILHMKKEMENTPWFRVVLLTLCREKGP